MARTSKVSADEIKTVIYLALDQIHTMHDLARRSVEKGFDDCPTLENAVHLMQFGNAVNELAEKMLLRIRMDADISRLEERIIARINAASDA